MTNKVYVLGYKTLDKDEIVPPKRPFDRVENVGVRFAAEPVWKFPDLATAKLECANLTQMVVHVGPHYCDLSVEALEGGEFAIVCLSHPSKLKLDDENMRSM